MITPYLLIKNSDIFNIINLISQEVIDPPANISFPSSASI